MTLTLEEQNGHFHVVQENHILFLMSNIHAVAFTNDAVPMWTILFIHNLLYVPRCHLTRE